MILAALELQVEQHIRELHNLRGELGHAVVVLNGHARDRTIRLGTGPMRVRVPRVRDRRPDHSKSTPGAPVKSPVDRPRKYSMGSASSRRGDRRMQGGRIFLL